MRIKYLALVLLTGFASVEAAAQSAPLKPKPSAKSDKPTYMITAHTVAYDGETNGQLDNYVVVYGSEILKVQYAESQISTVKPGASSLKQLAPGDDLHYHHRYGKWPQEPDVSQVPQVGVPIRACEMDTKYPDNDGHPVIAIQSVSAPCMSRNGDTLHYSLAPNGGLKMWEYVNFDILEATYSLGVAVAQSAPLRKDIPTIAKAANGAIVTIVMANNGKPIARGTGFLVRPDGVIVTNYHVIETGNVAVVKFADGTISPVDGVLATDKVRDLAIIKIHGKTFRTLTLGNSDQIKVGEEVVAIGNPLGLELTVSNGILSGVRTDEKEGGKFLQITAPISHGSSGGPLFNMFGEVVGINSMYLEGGENLNFAIPVNDAKRLLLNRSSNLQSLPNEPAPVDAEQADQGQPVTMEQQKMCAEQAERAFRKRFPDGRFLGGYVSYTSHYNPAGGVCFVEMSTSRLGTGAWPFHKSIDDAFGGKIYGSFQTVKLSGEDKPRQADCFIYLPGQEDIVCKSEQEFDALALKYFGVAP